MGFHQIVVASGLAVSDAASVAAIPAVAASSVDLDCSDFTQIQSQAQAVHDQRPLRPQPS